MHFFITGHTGFKGSWLTLLLKELGHEVSGYSLDVAKGGLFERASLDTLIRNHYLDDIRDVENLKAALEECRPDFAIHMAAQPLVLRSYEDPIDTYTTNVDGTRNFLEAITALEKPPVSLVVTTDKVYRDEGKGSYVESDPLGGHDPYSASKAMADLLTQSWAANNPQLKLHIARAGNVIGAYDVSDNRLIPDAVRAVEGSTTLQIRNPEAVRPWQHVLDCLSGYLAFLDTSHKGANLPVGLNFGPDPSSIRTVRQVLSTAQKVEPRLSYEIVASAQENFKETHLLTLDSSKAMTLLKWRNRLDFEMAVAMSFPIESESPLETVLSQIRRFLLNS